MFDSEDIPSKPTCRQYFVHKSCFQRHYTVTSVDDQPLLYGEISSFTHKPDLILHAGSDKHGPVIAMCKFPKFSSVLKVGLGGPDNVCATKWEDMTKENVGGSEYRWSTTLRGFPDSSERRKQLVWKRTQHVTADGVKASRLSSRNYKLLDEAGHILAVFTSNRTYKKCGKLQLNVNYGEDFDTMVFITCLGLYEKARRRKNKSAGGGGGGAP
ncbi:hypothetical protein BDV59DRAFT_96004 [Aspergillus ambiguus]|uniref:uncharacterized protein n=1 Tax=Aspergillus ambiguus TaxID=176160 RepID=UPI003CCE1996